MTKFGNYRFRVECVFPILISQGVELCWDFQHTPYICCHGFSSNTPIRVDLLYLETLCRVAYIFLV